MQQNIQNGLKQVMQKDMDRREFLTHIGVGFATIVGVTSTLKSLSQLGGTRPQTSAGYGANAYGGTSAKPQRALQ